MMRGKTGTIAKTKLGLWQALVIGGGVLAFVLMPHRCTHDVDDSFYPYKLTALRPAVYWGAGSSAELSEITATYDGRMSAISDCQAAAADYAREKQLERWSYVCCTVTPDSSCKTEVK